MNVVSWVACAVAWMKGGHPEGFGVAVLLTAALVECLFIGWRVRVLDAGIAANQAVLLMFFARLALRSDRWWPLAVAGVLILIMMVHLLTILTPVSAYAVESARVGLWLLLHVVVLAGIVERWLAGEVAISRLGRGETREAV